MAGDADWTGRVSGFFAAPPDRSRSRRRARYRVFAIAGQKRAARGKTHVNKGNDCRLLLNPGNR
jgi:hypothetical protein